MNLFKKQVSLLIERDTGGWKIDFGSKQLSPSVSYQSEKYNIIINLITGNKWSLEVSARNPRDKAVIKDKEIFYNNFQALNKNLKNYYGIDIPNRVIDYLQSVITRNDLKRINHMI